MPQELVDRKWPACFRRVFALNGSTKGTQVALKSETQSRPVLVHLSEMALYDLGADFCMITMPTPPQTTPARVKGTGILLGRAGRRGSSVSGWFVFCRVASGGKPAAGRGTNPNLTTAATVAAGVAGIFEGVEPEAEVIGNGHAAGSSVPDYARSMPEAIAGLRASTRARDWLRRRIVETFSATRASQYDEFRKRVPDVELARFFDLG